MLLIAKKMNKHENLFLWATNNSVSTVATDVEEKPGKRWELTEKTVYALISKEIKYGLGELGAHVPQGSLR